MIGGMEFADPRDVFNDRNRPNVAWERQWLNIFDNYLQCVLSLQKDKLIAVAGAAEMTADIAGLCGADYLAGH